MRFAVRKVHQGWMVWDTVKRSVATVDDIPAVGVTEEAAKRFADMLNSQDEITKKPPQRSDGRILAAKRREARVSITAAPPRRFCNCGRRHVVIGRHVRLSL
jgi:hypothetical protein